LGLVDCTTPDPFHEVSKAPVVVYRATKPSFATAMAGVSKTRAALSVRHVQRARRGECACRNSRPELMGSSCRVEGLWQYLQSPGHGSEFRRFATVMERPYSGAKKFLERMRSQLALRAVEIEPAPRAHARACALIGRCNQARKLLTVSISRAWIFRQPT
jgi:hypothetical protein